MVIYKTTNLLNGKIYIGKDCGRNPGYLGSGVWIKRSIAKHGKENFKKEILEVCDLSNVCEREIYWISLLRARDPKIGYNIAAGGDGGQLGAKVSEETRKKHRLQKHACGKEHPNFGKPMPECVKEKQRISHLGSRNHFFGKKHTEKVKRKISNSIYAARHKGKATGMTGKKHSEESIQKMREVHKGLLIGRHHTEEAKNKMSLAAMGNKRCLGKHLSEEHKRKISASEKLSKSKLR